MSLNTCIKSRSAVYEPLIKKISDSIREQRLRPGDFIGSEMQFVAAEGISRVSVRKAISLLVHDGLIERRPGKGLYVRDANKLTRTVQVIVPNITVEQNSRVALGVQQAGLKAGAIVQVCGTSLTVDQGAEVVRRLPESQADGAVIFAMAHPRFVAALYELKLKEFPFVLVDEPLEHLGVDSVTSDNYGGGFAVGRELAKLGHQRVGFIGNIGANTARLRLSGMQDALSDAGIVIDRSLVKPLDVADPLSDWSSKITAATTDLIMRADRPTAIFCSCDQVAAWVYVAVKNAGLRIPDDISVVGFDDTSVCHVLDPALTTVSQSLEEMGQIAFEYLVRRMNESSVDHLSSVMPTHWTPRGSLCSRLCKNMNAA